MVIGKGYITIAVIHDGVDGADGYTVTASPSVITLGIRKVSDTEFAADVSKNNTSAIRVFKGDVNVTGTCRVTVMKTENCTATGPFENASGLVKVTRMSTYTTADGVTYPFTTGSVTVAINTGSTTLSHTVAVNVDMSLVWGGVETTVRGLKSSEAGGGTVIIPAGLWKTGPITMMSNVNLHLQAGAMVVFSADPKDNPIVNTGKELKVMPLINGTGLKNIAITGNVRLPARRALPRSQICHLYHLYSHLYS